MAFEEDVEPGPSIDGGGGSFLGFDENGQPIFGPGGGGGGFPFDFSSSGIFGQGTSAVGSKSFSLPNFLKGFGVKAGKAAAGAAAPSIFDRILGKTGAERALRNFSTAGFGSDEIQNFLPLSLRAGFTEPILAQGIQGIGDLIRNPGGLSPNIADAIRARLAVESEGIAGNFRGIRANQAGAAARQNIPVSIRAALESALDVAQSRAQRGARRGALQDSDQLQRSDLDQTFKILDAILQFTSSGRGQAIQGLGASAGASAQRRASNLTFAGDILSELGISDLFKKSNQAEA